MSSIAAVLLMYLNEEDAFWALVILIGSPKYAMHGMLIPGLPKLLAYCDFHATMRKRFISRLDRHLVSTKLNTRVGPVIHLVKMSLKAKAWSRTFLWVDVHDLFDDFIQEPILTE